MIDFLTDPENHVRNIAVIVAHPDDETLWAGGQILDYPMGEWFIASLCRSSDPDRSQKFLKILNAYHAHGGMADLDDGPQQIPLSISLVKGTILEILPRIPFDLIITHAPKGEYTSHRRHEEVSSAVSGLWRSGTLVARQLWMFAYTDEQGSCLPHAIKNATYTYHLSPETFRKKYELINQVYGFDKATWEARAVPIEEAFWCFQKPQEIDEWCKKEGSF